MALPLADKVISRTEPIRRVAREVVSTAASTTAAHFAEAGRDWAAWASRPKGRAKPRPVERYQDELREAAGSDRRREIVRLSNLASAYRRDGELAQAQICATRAVEVAREVADDRLLGLTLNGLGLVQSLHPVQEPALASFAEAREVFTRLGDSQIEGQVLSNVGKLHARRGDREAARTAWAEALAVLAPDSSAHERLADWLAAHPEADRAEEETAESPSERTAKLSSPPSTRRGGSMPILQIEHAVRDFDAWKHAFDADPIGREENGVRRYRIVRPTDDPAYVAVDLEFDDLDAAEAFRASLLELWERRGDELGLQGAKARIVEAVEKHEY